MSKLIVGAAVAVAVLWLLPATAQAQKPASNQLTVALKEVQKTLPGALLLLGRAENKPSGNVLGFYFWIKGKVWEMEWKDKKVVMKKQVDTPSAADNVSPEVVKAVSTYRGAKLPYARYIEIALKAAGGGDPQRIEVKLSEDRLVIQVDIGAADGSTKSVIIDLASGKVLSGG